MGKSMQWASMDHRMVKLEFWRVLWRGQNWGNLEKKLQSKDKNHQQTQPKINMMLSPGIPNPSDLQLDWRNVISHYAIEAS